MKKARRFISPPAGFLAASFRWSEKKSATPTAHDPAPKMNLEKDERLKKSAH